MAPNVSAADAEKSQERPKTTALREVTRLAKVVLSIAAIWREEAMSLVNIPSQTLPLYSPVLPPAGRKSS